MPVAGEAGSTCKVDFMVSLSFPRALLRTTGVTGRWVQVLQSDHEQTQIFDFCVLAQHNRRRAERGSIPRYIPQVDLEAWVCRMSHGTAGLWGAGQITVAGGR